MIVRERSPHPIYAEVLFFLSSSCLLWKTFKNFNQKLTQAYAALIKKQLLVFYKQRNTQELSLRI